MRNIFQAGVYVVRLAPDLESRLTKIEYFEANIYRFRSILKEISKLVIKELEIEKLYYQELILGCYSQHMYHNIKLLANFKLFS